ncbi:hypothetical protein AZ16_3250, partial [Bordetella bronchiseptica B18-5 (C3)]
MCASSPARARAWASDTIPAQGRAALGALNSLHYADTLDNPANLKFVADYRARFKDYP